jgi:SRSO17 transposase
MAGKTAESKYFLCDLPAKYSLRRLAQVAKSRWKIEQHYQQLNEELGLDHYEGRSLERWHHHVTLVMLTHSLLTLETLRRNFWLDPVKDAS